MQLRPARPEDRNLLRRVYVSSRLDELAQTGWSQRQIEDFLSGQFEAQHRYYQNQFPNAEFQVVMLDDQPIGRLYIGWWESDVRLIDIALFPEYRNRGIGTKLIREVMDAARDRGKPVRLHVEKFNPALRLYERLGFQVIENRGVNYFMEWHAG